MVLPDAPPPDEHEDLLLDTVRGLTSVPGADRRADMDWLVEVFEDQSTTRHLDLAARWLRAAGEGHYTIGSAGHEANAVIARAARVSDPALLHYRSVAFHLARSRQAGRDGVDDVVAGLVAAADEPIAGGRHKVIGHPDLAIVPQTSTIASHLPRSVGVAVAIGRARRLGLPSRWPSDAVAICSFGDASANHSTALGAVNAARWAVRSGVDVPLLLVCEDNGLGISVPTPRGWIESSFGSQEHLEYRHVDGSRPTQLMDVAVELLAVARSGRPAFLHVDCVRFGGHAGSDVESSYRSAAELRADRARDPLLGTAEAIVSAGLATGDELADLHLDVRRRVLDAARARIGTPRLVSRGEVMAPLAPRSPALVAERVVATRVSPQPDADPAGSAARTLAETINATLAEVLATRPGALVFGEDVGRKGGVYGVTRGLQRRFGAARVFDTLLDEQSILGMALGAAISGMLPIPEIQYLAYLHNAEDQLRGEAATLQFFSRGAYRNGMVVRVAGLAYQLGFGGHFHNDSSVAVLRDVPGLVIGCPAHPADAAGMLRTLVAAAEVDGTVSVLLEPIARYHTRDLMAAGDGRWTAAAQDAFDAPIGVARTVRPGRDVTVVTFGNGAYLSWRVAERLATAGGVDVEVVDLRWLAPLPVEAIASAASDRPVVVVDETRRTAGVGEGVVAALVEAGHRGPLRLVAGADSFVPLGTAAELVLVSEADIETAITEVTSR